MNLYRIGNHVLNIDRLNGILDAGGGTLRVIFDQGEIELTGKEAEAFRYWYRHASHNLVPRCDEDGEELIPPEDQVRESLDVLVAQVDRTRPGDSAMRRSAHRLRVVVERFLTGELQAVPARDFRESLEERVTA